MEPKDIALLISEDVNDKIEESKQPLIVLEEGLVLEGLMSKLFMTMVDHFAGVSNVETPAFKAAIRKNDDLRELMTFATKFEINMRNVLSDAKKYLGDDVTAKGNLDKVMVDATKQAVTLIKKSIADQLTKIAESMKAEAPPEAPEAAPAAAAPAAPAAAPVAAPAGAGAGI
jgi:hypothetical protein